MDHNSLKFTTSQLNKYEVCSVYLNIQSPVFIDNLTAMDTFEPQKKKTKQNNESGKETKGSRVKSLVTYLLLGG